MKNFAFAFLIIIATTSSTAFSQNNRLGSCIKQDVAKKLAFNFLKQFQGELVSNIDDLHSFKLNKRDRSNYLTASKIQNIVSSIKWKSLPREYQSEVFIQGACAPGAECWAFMTILCSGEIWVTVDGTD